MKYVALFLIVLGCLNFQMTHYEAPWESYLEGFEGFSKKICEEFQSNNCTECIINIKPTIGYITNLINILKNGTNIDMTKLFIWIAMEFPLIASEGKTCYSAYDVIDAISAYIKEAEEEKSKYAAKLVTDLLEEVLNLPEDIKLITNYIAEHKFDMLGEEIASIILRVFHPEL